MKKLSLMGILGFLIVVTSALADDGDYFKGYNDGRSSCATTTWECVLSVTWVYAVGQGSTEALARQQTLQNCIFVAGRDKAYACSGDMGNDYTECRKVN